VKSLIDTKYKMLGSAFRALDEDGSGTVDRDEFEMAISHFNLGFPRGKLTELFDEIDADGSGEITYAEFCKKMRSMEAGGGHMAGVGASDRTLDGHHVMTSNMARGSGGGQVIMSDYHYLPRAELEKARAT
jgi:hypothetical protein